MKLDCLFAGVTAVTLGERGVLKNAWVGVSGGKIVYLDTKAPRDVSAGRIIERPRRVLIPGLINAHTHISMTALRGYADDLPLHRWLNERIFPAEAKLSERGVYLGARLGMLEAIASGTTGIVDAYFKLSGIARAARETGLHANICNMLTWFGEGAAPDTDNAFREALELQQEYSGDELVRADAGLHAVYTSNPESWEKIARFAQEHGMRLHVHISETKKENEDCIARWGASPVEVLERAGVFGSPVTAAHCVYLSDRDREILRAHDAVIVHNPTSNCKLASGIADVEAMEGITTALGTDGVASNNRHDLFAEMKLAALLGKVRTLDASALPAGRVLRMATEGGARAMGRENRAGRIEPGYDADLALLNFDTPRLSPCYDTLSHLVYAATGEDVELTMSAGRILYENGEFPGIDAERCMRELREYTKETFGE